MFFFLQPSHSRFRHSQPSGALASASGPKPLWCCIRVAPWKPWPPDLVILQRFGKKSWVVSQDVTDMIPIGFYDILCKFLRVFPHVPQSNLAMKSIQYTYIYIPIGSMYGIYANIGGILMVNVTIYSIHGSYGYMYNHQFWDSNVDSNLKRSSDLVQLRWVSVRCYPSWLVPWVWSRLIYQ